MLRFRYGKTVWRLVLVVTLAVAGFASASGAAAQQEPIHIIFMHHSTGENLIFQGGVIEGFAELGYEFWHHGYNGDGLSDRDGNYTYVGWDVPDDNTDPDGWYTVFNQPVTDPPTNAFSHMLQYDVIIFKSCFPSSNIEDEGMFEAYQRYYLSIRDIIDQHPDKLFIPWTTPPLVPNSTDPESAARARRWAQYLTSDEYLAGHPNIYVFDIFNLWADESGYLRADYRVDEWDSHPNELANQTVGPIFVNFVDHAIRHFWQGGPPPSLPVAPAPGAIEVPEAPPTAPEDVSGRAGLPGSLIDDFEGGDFADRWWTYADEGAAAFSCELGQPGYDYDYGMQITLDLGPGMYAGCGRDIENGQEWAGAGGLTFMWQADTPGMPVGVVLSVDGTPFEAYVQTPGLEWTPVTLTWGDFARAEWADPGGAEVFDPASVTELDFALGDWQNPQRGTIWIDAVQLVSGGEEAAPVGGSTSMQAQSFDKFALWTGGTQLRGANVWQRVVVPWVDGDEFLGDGHVGPPFVQEDFDLLAALGANYVNISGPGLFTEEPPYVLDEAVQANLDSLLEMIAQADMFAVITARTGPGRSDFTFYWDETADWGDASLLNDDVWLDQAAQDAWVEMWHYTAERYRDNPIVVGYDLMCEPNGPDRLLDIWDGETFYASYGGTLYDWNPLYPRIVAAIREVDPDTPILISAMGWGAVRWLPYLQPVDDPHVVYMVHQYEPQEQYTHQEYPAANTYPGTFDLDWDGVPDTFDRHWLDEYLSTIDAFQYDHGAVVGVNEFGVMRWVPNAADFMRDSMELFEQRGMNHAFWAWNPLWPPYQHIDDMNYLRGPDPNNHTDLATNDLLEVIRSFWGRNTVRPSNVAP